MQSDLLMFSATIRLHYITAVTFTRCASCVLAFGLVVVAYFGFVPYSMFCLSPPYLLNKEKLPPLKSCCALDDIDFLGISS